MFRTDSFKNREVINIDTAERIGVVADVEIDTESGNIKSLIVKRSGILNVLGRELIIPWNSIAVIGKEIILVRVVEIIKSSF